jgi:uncharacterized protein
MGNANEELLRALYDAFGRKDFQAIEGLLSDDVVVHQPGRNPLSGDYRGKEAALGLIRSLGERSGGTLQIHVHDVVASDEHAVALLRVTGQREGRELDLPVVQVWHVRDGKLTELWIHPLDLYAIDEFWA